MEKVNELYKKNDEAITNSAKEMVKAFKSKAEQASNPFTHEGATYKDNDTKGGHTWAYTDMEKGNSGYCKCRTWRYLLPSRRKTW